MERNNAWYLFKIVLMGSQCFTGNCIENTPQALPHKDYAEYCQTQTFNASCPPGHVILMTHARYGRMQIGKCVKLDYGSMGCSRDVIGLTDIRCSGKASCSITVPDVLFDKTQPCPEDLKPYLEVGYSCVKISRSNRHCSLIKAKETNSDAGFILKSPDSMESCGTRQSPWVLESKAGQTITVTLHDLGIESRTHENTAHSFVQCHLLAILRETSGGKSKNVTVCGRTTRELVVLSTQANKVEIVTQPAARSHDAYILKYQISGCPQIKPPPMSWVVRNGDSALVKCNHTRQMFHLTCNGTSWKGSMSNCSLANSARRNDEDEEVVIPYGISVMIVIIIALVIGLVVLILGLLFLRKQHNICVRRNTRDNTTYAPDKDYASSTYYQTYTPKQGRPIVCGDAPLCTPLMNASIYGQIPERLSCGCPVYISRDELAGLKNGTLPQCCSDRFNRSRSTELLDNSSENSTPKLLNGPDMLPQNERQQLIQSLQTDNLLRNNILPTHSTFKQSPPKQKPDELSLKLRFDNAVNESLCEDNRPQTEPKTQVVKPLPIVLPPCNKSIGAIHLPLPRSPNSY